MRAPGWCFPGAPQPKVLILASSVVGTPSLEESAVRALHPTWQVDVASDDQWKALSAADFASYQAIILGDPDCDTFEGERQKTCIAGRVFAPKLIVHLITARTPLLLELPDEFSSTNHHATRDSHKNKSCLVCSLQRMALPQRPPAQYGARSSLAT
jgi:hypothetical protein